MKGRPLRSGVTLSRLERTAIVVAISSGLLLEPVGDAKERGAFLVQAHLCRQSISAAGEAFACACETSLDTTDAMTLGDLPLL